ncbi:hypothetical protein B0H67DRAFT_651795 [Lasiosphaeris hirsuta]|uniref:Uncharacterized protein n=1 Tax=Lasiosphaeris hirsuta TaxID=260670 RepID=A0AA40B9I9_9PEZI|nr:hypothetical protein B0H67DRAFT_651795 [Lasiosphaeris hirsuta]
MARPLPSTAEALAGAERALSDILFVARELRDSQATLRQEIRRFVAGPVDGGSRGTSSDTAMSATNCGHATTPPVRLPPTRRAPPTQAHRRHSREPLPRYSPPGPAAPEPATASNADPSTGMIGGDWSIAPGTLETPSPEYHQWTLPPTPFSPPMQRAISLAEPTPTPSSPPPNYHTALQSDYTHRRKQLQTSWRTWAQNKRAEHRIDYLAWRDTRNPHNNNNNNNQDRPAGPAPTPADSISNPSPNPSLRRRVCRSVARAVMANKAASWWAKTRRWKRERRVYREELEAERRAFYLLQAQELEAEFAARMEAGRLGEPGMSGGRGSRGGGGGGRDGKGRERAVQEWGLLAIRADDFPMPDFGPRPKMPNL